MVKSFSKSLQTAFDQTCHGCQAAAELFANLRQRPTVPVLKDQCFSLHLGQTVLTRRPGTIRVHREPPRHSARTDRPRSTPEPATTTTPLPRPKASPRPGRDSSLQSSATRRSDCDPAPSASRPVAGPRRHPAISCGPRTLPKAFAGPRRKSRLCYLVSVGKRPIFDFVLGLDAGAR